MENLLRMVDDFDQLGRADLRQIAAERTRRLRPAEAALFVDGSRAVRAFVSDEVSAAVRQWRSVAKERADANVARPREECESVVDIYVTAFNQLVRPALDTLADLMGKDVHPD